MLSRRFRPGRVELVLAGVAFALFACSAPNGHSGGSPSLPAPWKDPTLAVTALVNASAPADDLIGSYICGGALVAPQIVVTAAHCVVGRAATSVDVVVGADNLCQGAPISGDRLEVSRITVLGGRDIALLQLREPSRLTPMVADPQQPPEGTLTALGWGRASEVGPSPCTRTAVRLDQRDGEDCADLFRDRADSASPDWLCATPAVGQSRNTCVGDSGGPLLDGTGAHQRLVGVTSFGEDCGAGSVGVYASLLDLSDLLAPPPR